MSESFDSENSNDSESDSTNPEPKKVVFFQQPKLQPVINQKNEVPQQHIPVKKRALRPAVEAALQQLRENPNQEPITDPPLKQLKAVQFGVLGAEEIRAIGVSKLTKSKITPPYLDTVYDERMGPSDPRSFCSTCSESIRNCPGHFGYIELATPVIHPQFIKTVVSILNCVCLNCAKLKVNKDEIDLETTTMMKQFDLVKTVCSSMPICRHCDEPNPQIVLKDSEIYMVLTEVDKSKKPSLMTIDEIESVLKRVSIEDLQTMGFDIKFRKAMKHNVVEELLPSFRPEHFIIKLLPVIPPISRPPNFEGGIKSDDDLTSSYTEIIKNNQKILESQLTEREVQEKMTNLKSYIRSFIDNTDESTKHTSGKPIKSIKERISSKNGHIRGKMMGKRVDVSARTVITADPTLRLDEVGVPHEIASVLTYPETVTKVNFDRLTELMESNKINMLKRGSKIYMMNIMKQNLELGDIAYRHLQDGDLAVFNRQPTLHRGGMMAHKVRVLPGKTLRMNLAVTAAYNADFLKVYFLRILSVL